MQQRYYEPIAGRFLSVDPVTTDDETGGHFNRYAYANNNPFRFIDPDGRSPCTGTLIKDGCPAGGGISHSSSGTSTSFGDAGSPESNRQGLSNTKGDQALVAGAKVVGREAAMAALPPLRLLRFGISAKGATQAGTSLLPKGITQVKNAKGEVFKEVQTPPSRPHAGMAEHTHPNYRNVLPDGTVRTGVSKDAVPVSRRDIIDATRPGAQRTGVPE
jgi:uncharacterized protein RhaS with RHS repeats